ncbi:hypothetical protein VP01_1467g4, partial [Puccinia sorghi]
SDSGHSTNSDRDTNPNPSENSLKEPVEHLLLQEWGFQQCDLQKMDPLPLDTAEIQARISKETNTHVCFHTVQCYLKKLNLKLLVTGVESGKISLDKVYQARMRSILASTQFKSPGMQLVYNILKEVNPEGMTACLFQTCTCHVFCTYGPNHIWSCDGHDMLKQFRITVYGFIDAWSRKILGITGGIPQKVMSDYGSENVHMATWKMYVLHQHGLINVHNQRIESLWSQMMKQHNCYIIDKILTQIENGIYDPDDTLHNLVCYSSFSYGFQLFNPVWTFGSIFKIIIEKGETTPSQPQMLELHTLHAFFLQHDYPEIEAMFTHTPEWFHEVAVAIMAALEINSEHITIGNVWHVFSCMLPSIQLHFQQHEYPDLSPQHSEEIQASKADGDYK